MDEPPALDDDDYYDYDPTPSDWAEYDAWCNATAGLGGHGA